MRVHLPQKDVFRWLIVLSLFLAPGVEAEALWPVLTNAAQVRGLRAVEAAQARAVQLRGVVISLATPRDEAAILADATAGIYLLAATNLFADCHRGDALEVEGVTDPGQFAPIVRVTSFRMVGTVPLPKPRPVTYQDLITGSLDGQWVEISGVVHTCTEPAKPNDIWRIYLAANGGIVSIRVPSPRDPRVQEDAEVGVQAICLYQFNQRRQVLTPVLQVPDGLGVRLDKAAPENPFDAPLRSAGSLLQFSPDNTIGHRVHVHGVVTYAERGSLVWIRDGNSGLRVQTRQNEHLEPGDQVEVLGFPAYGSSPPLLEDAVFRKTGRVVPPEPVQATATNAFAFEDDLISVEAVISDVQPVLEGTAVTLNSGGTVFKALLKSSPLYRDLPGWEPHSLVRVAGICSVVHDDERPLMGIWQPQSFQIRMRSPDDLVVLSRPPWWTPPHIILFLGCAIGGMMLATGVVMLLARHRLKEQTRERARAESEFAAILAERNRLARDIHDTLAQGLAATSVQLRLARKQSKDASPQLQQYLESAQQLVRSSLQEARNSIWNMRSQVLENADLAGALKGILEQMTGDTEVQTQVEVVGHARRLAPVVENNLLRVGQEAITNAIKHGRPARIRVMIEFQDTEFRLTVSDDGCGFDPAKSWPSGPGGFGLVGMRERLAELKGRLTIRSKSGHGSEISVTIPLAAETG